MNYEEFLRKKQIRHSSSGIDVDVNDLNVHLFDWQKAIVKWSLNKGGAAIFADCGLGKTPMQLEWANQITKHTNGKVLILTPLAVSPQTIKEGEKFGIEVIRSQDGKPAGQITVTNYERLHMFDSTDYSGVVCDESSILKNFAGKRKNEITQFVKRMPYRLFCTATAAPNDYIELGTTSEALGVMGYMDMLNRFFKNDQSTSDTKANWRCHGGGSPKWRFKRHAEDHFWKWVCSWAIALRKPSDIGYCDDGFVLPNLIENEIVMPISRPMPGCLFPEVASNLHEQRIERRETLSERCEKAASLLNHNSIGVAWCHLNDEGDAIEKMIPDSEQVKGGMSDDRKESILTDFANGNIRVLVTKPKIGAFGLNWQHCNHMTTFPSHSYEQYYQMVRRCWRFGQKKPVTVDIVTSSGEAAVMQNLQKKAIAADNMFTKLVEFMNNSNRMEIKNPHIKKGVNPSWL